MDFYIVLKRHRSATPNSLVNTLSLLDIAQLYSIPVEIIPQSFQKIFLKDFSHMS